MCNNSLTGNVRKAGKAAHDPRSETSRSADAEEQRASLRCCVMAVKAILSHGNGGCTAGDIWLPWLERELTVMTAAQRVPPRPGRGSGEWPVEDDEAWRGDASRDSLGVEERRQLCVRMLEAPALPWFHHCGEVHRSLGAGATRALGGSIPHS